MLSDAIVIATCDRCRETANIAIRDHDLSVDDAKDFAEEDMLVKGWMIVRTKKGKEHWCPKCVRVLPPSG